MARDLPGPTPEGALIRRVRESIHPRLSVPAAAALAKVGEATWGNVERGYRTSGREGSAVRVVARAQTLAHMAYAIGLQPADLAAAGRQDAAEVLGEMYGPDLEVEVEEVDDGLIFIPVPKDASPEDREKVRRIAERVVEEYFRDAPNEPN